MITREKGGSPMKELYTLFYDVSGAFYIIISLLLRASYDWEKTTFGQKTRQFVIGLLLSLLVNKVYLDIYSEDVEMMKYIGLAIFAFAFLGEIALDIILKKIVNRFKDNTE